MTEHGRALVIGVGNELRGDDGAGVWVARRLRADPRAVGIDVREEQGDATRLLGAWRGYGTTIVIDAARSGATPGTVQRLDASDAPLAGAADCSTSTHALALGETIELARTLGQLPARVIVYAIEGRAFELGDSISESTRAAVVSVAAAVLRDASAVAGDP